MLHPDQTRITQAYTAEFVEKIEEIVDEQLSHATAMTCNIHAIAFLFSFQEDRPKSYVRDVDDAVLLAVAARYVEHWHVLVRPDPNTWLKLTAKLDFRQRMYDQIAIAHMPKSDVPTPAAPRPDPSREASRTDIEHLQHDALVLLELAKRAQRSLHEQELAGDPALNPVGDDVRRRVAAYLQTLPSGRALPDGKLPA